MSELTVQEMQPEDVPFVVRYWTGADPDFLQSMGADQAKVPEAEALTAMLLEQVHLPDQEKGSLAFIAWMKDERIGHCNVNNITFGEHAFLHLHLWPQGARQRGLGTHMVQQALPHFLHRLALRTVFCEPFALNPAPNRTLEKIGFALEKEYVTTPGWINFEQPVKRWAMTRELYERLHGPLNPDRT